jgi:hypothetical protein
MVTAPTRVIERHELDSRDKSPLACAGALEAGRIEPEDTMEGLVTDGDGDQDNARRAEEEGQVTPQPTQNRASAGLVLPHTEHGAVRG